MPLTYDEAVARLVANEERFDRFMNGDENGTYTSTDEVVVPSLQKLAKAINDAQLEIDLDYTPFFQTLFDDANAGEMRSSLELGTAATADSTAFATAAQGALADSATQPADLATVATSGAYADLSGLPTLGSAAAADTTDFAAAAHTHPAAEITDFDTEVSNNTDVAANTAARHDAVTVLDSTEIDFTLTGQQITASLKAGSIDEAKLDASVNASLDLADSAVQPADIGTAAAEDIGAFATAAQGISADTAFGWGDHGAAGYLTTASAAATYQPLDADLTAIAALADPNADRILFWDDSAGAYAYLQASTGLTISTTSLTVRSASSTETGIVELATDAEAITGTDTARALTPANAKAAYQPLDTDLTSWAGVTRASGFDTFAATPTSANLKTLVTDETGSGALVFGTSPALTTPNLGTPSAVTLTNGTGLPQAGTVGLTTADSPQFAGVNIGHATDTTLSRSAAGKIAVEGIDVALLSGAQTLADKTLVEPTIQGSIIEDVFTITDAAGFAVDPANGSIQYITLGASRTPVPSGWAAGQSVTLRIADGTAFAITWSGFPVVWKGGVAPTLATTGYTEVNIEFSGGVYRGVTIGDFAS